MRKLKLQMQMSLDGFVSTGSNDEQLWVTWAWDEIRTHVLKLLDSSDTILIGRKLAVDYIPYWLDVYTRPDDPMYPAARGIVKAKKIIFTKTLEKSDWDNTWLAKGGLVDEVIKLKSQDGQDIIVYGGTSFVSALIREELIDEFHFFINPVVLGHGESVFSRLIDVRQLTLKHSIVYNCGIILLQYEPKSFKI